MESSDDLVQLAAANLDRRPHVKPWWLRITDDQRQRIRPLWHAWHDGQLGTREITACRAIAKTLGTLGIQIGPQGVKAWLKTPDW